MKYNHNFAILGEGGLLTYAPRPLVIDDNVVYTNDSTIYIENGYYPIVKTEQPVKEGYYYTEYYEQVENEIVQKWAEHEDNSRLVEDAEPIDLTQLKADVDFLLAIGGYVE